MADRKNHDKKAKAFSDKQKQKNAYASQPKTHLVPDVTWQSTDMLGIRGDVAEAIQNNLVAGYEALQRAGQAFQVFLNMAIKEGTAKLDFTWNNGEKPTEAEINEYKAQMEQLNKLKQEQLKKAQEGIQQEAQEKNEAKQPQTNLITPDGRPLTEENLSKGPSLIV